MVHVTTVIIGAGHSGLAMSRELAQAGIDHVILERGQVGNSWRTERWDSLRLLSPNWLNGLPGHAYRGDDRDGYMHVSELIERFDQCTALNGAPVQTETRVMSVSGMPGNYTVQTDQGMLTCESVVMANGACARPKVPAFAAELPSHVQRFTPHSYKRPSQLPDGKVLVVGASASGLQLAREVQQSGRQVVLAVGNHLRLPRRYRDADITMWLEAIGATTIPYSQVDDIERVRRTPSLTLVASETIDLNTLQDMGVEVTGRLAGIAQGRALFSGSLPNLCTAADLKMNRLLGSIDEWLTENDLSELVAPTERFAPTRVSASPRLSMDLTQEGFGSVIWATGYQPDFSWLNLPVFDRKGRLMHDGGVVAEGLYAMGLPYLRQRKSTFIDGACDDAKALAAHLKSGLGQLMAA
ncbi:MAG: NAD(P)-binding domain-containing protein [Boseongicola sp.]